MIPAHIVSALIEILEKELQRLAVDANLCDKYGATYPAALNASKRRKKLLKVLEYLKTHKEGVVYG